MDGMKLASSPGSALYIIDIVGAPLPSQQSEILSRILRHAVNREDAQQQAMQVIEGVSFAGADAVRVLTNDGIEIFFWRLNPEHSIPL